MLLTMFKNINNQEAVVYQNNKALASAFCNLAQRSLRLLDIVKLFGWDIVAPC